MKRLLVMLIGLNLAGCNAGPDNEVEMLRVSPDEFVISLLADGELRAAESTTIRPPPGSHNPRTISWLAPNHSAVKKGEVIARFDASDAVQGAIKTGIELTKVDLQVMAKQRELERLQSELGGELEIVDMEKVMAEQFNVDDSLVYSRFEIIDATRDKALIEYRGGHLEDKKDNYTERQIAELEVLDAIRATQQIENREHQQQINHSEVHAPHDGFFVYEKNWWGQQVDVGSLVFPENNIARIPNLDKMEAVLQVLETEAAGLAPGQRANMVIDAYPDRTLTGVVKSISAAATPIARDVPVKFFSVIVSLDQSDPAWITPEAQVTAEIHISRLEDAITIPNQATFQDETGDWVLVRKGSALEKRSVRLGMRGANRSEVVSGLQAGDEVALYPPEGWSL